MKFFGIDATNRIFGLDLLRFFAIMFVVLGHSKILIPDQYDVYVGKTILDGVSIFFVLSGFLIGQILIKQINAGNTSWRALLHFWSRRWLRTLPVYFFVLIFLLLYTFDLKPERIPDDWYKYFFFLQNFFVIQPSFFNESWSLSIEEWFYLIIPFLIFLFLYFFPKKIKAVILFVIFATIIFVLVYRYYLYLDFKILNEKNFYLDMLTQVFPRLDGIMLGVFAAFIAVYYSHIWKKIAKFYVFILMFLSLYLFKQFVSDYNGVFHCVWMPLIKSIAVFFMLPYLSNLKLKKINMIAKIITLISVISYSLYLVNRTIVIDIVFKYLIHDNLLKSHEFGDYWVIEYILFWIVCIVFSFLMYRFIETPFLKMRKKSI
jgi:peptidoglycan/LPS O-acetylase OafA/YrhL